MSTQRHLSLWLLIAALLSLPVAAAAAPDPAYTAIRNARPDGRSVPVNNLVLERDVYRFQFDSGAFHFLSPVEGRTVGAVFVGKGSYRLSPAKESERRQFALSSGADPKTFETFTDNFDDLLLLFADDTAKEIEIHAPMRTGSLDARAAALYEVYLKRQKKDFRTNFHLRVLQDVLNEPNLTSGVFMALIDGKKHTPVLAAVDPNGSEAIRIGFRMGGEDTMFFVADPNRGGIWYHCDQKGEVDRKRASPEKVLADAQHYIVETSIERDEDLAGNTEIQFQTLVPNLRVLPVDLTENLRIQEVSYAVAAEGAEPAWKPAAWVQEEKKEDAEVAVIFPEPLGKKGTGVRLKVSYKGDEVLRDGGDKNYYVGARTSWYANLGGFADPATFELTYRVPAGNEIISVGRQLEAKDEGTQSVSKWKTDHPVQVAGFNYGKFKKFEKQDEYSKVAVGVFTNPGTPNIIREINSAMSGEDFRSASWEGFETDDAAPRESLGKVNTEKLAESSLADGLNSARLFTTYFGKLPQTHVYITQQSDFGFGQSWPSLIFMPYISFLDGTQRQRLDMAGAKDFVDQVGYHEFAHQWWGHMVGAATYRDQWIEEGFSEFSAAVAVQHTRNWGEYDRFWRERRKEILNVFPGNATGAWEAGPVTNGFRLATPKNPSAYRLLIYPKGGYILHMLRMMMYDPSSQDPDAKFKDMMRDFTSTHGGKFATTADFQKIVEKHMVPAMNATGDGKMDWFFNQWVYGYEVPRYVSDLKISSSGGDYVITGTIRQEGVSKDFRALVPIYVELSKTETARVALLPLVGESSSQVNLTVKLPKKPRRALVNARGELLARD